MKLSALDSSATVLFHPFLPLLFLLSFSSVFVRSILSLQRWIIDEIYLFMSDQMSIIF